MAFAPNFGVLIDFLHPKPLDESIWGEALQGNSPILPVCPESRKLSNISKLSSQTIHFYLVKMTFFEEMMFLGNDDRSKFCMCWRIYGKFPESSTVRNSKCFWRVLQKLSGFIWRVECGALRKCMESLKVCYILF